MKIQNINYTTFGKFGFKNKENDIKKNQILNCSIDNYSDDKKEFISFSFDKEELFKFFKSIINKTTILKDKDNKNSVKINFSIKEPTNLENSEPEKNKHDINVETPNFPTPDFPTPKFQSNPTVEQRDEYIKDILNYFESTPNIEDRLKALKEIEKYGTNDLYKLAKNLIGGGNETLMQETLKIYSKWGTADEVYNIIEPIAVSKVKITEEKTFIELLKTIQKLAKLENDSEQDRKIVLEPIRRLLNYENENIKKMAQETLDKITPKN